MASFAIAEDFAKADNADEMMISLLIQHFTRH
jgi:hypothetical protein